MIQGKCNSWISFLVLYVSWFEILNLSLQPRLSVLDFVSQLWRKIWKLDSRLLKSSFIHRLSSSRMRLSQSKPSANHFQYWKWCVCWMRSGVRPASGEGLGEVWEWDQRQGRGWVRSGNETSVRGGAGWGLGSGEGLGEVWEWVRSMNETSVRGGAAILASFPGSHAPEHEHWSCTDVESLVFVSHEQPQR